MEARFAAALPQVAASGEVTGRREHVLRSLDLSLNGENRTSGDESAHQIHSDQGPMLARTGIFPLTHTPPPQNPTPMACPPRFLVGGDGTVFFLLKKKVYVKRSLGVTGRVTGTFTFFTMQRHDSQERMEAGSPRAAAPPASLDSSPLSSSSRSSKRRHVSTSGSP